MDSAKTELKINTKFLNKVTKCRVVSNRFDKTNFIFKEMNQSGKKKFLVQYKEYKTHDLFILQDENELKQIQEFLM